MKPVEAGDKERGVTSTDFLDYRLAQGSNKGTMGWLQGLRVDNLAKEDPKDPRNKLSRREAKS